MTVERTLLGIKVQSALAMDPLANVIDIGVEIEDDEVKLSGTLDNYAHQLHIERIVAAVDGVDKVTSEFTIGDGGFAEKSNFHSLMKPLSQQDCITLKKRIEEGLERLYPNDAPLLDVIVNPTGTVQLNGEISNIYLKQAVENYVWTFSKVTWIHNKLKTLDAASYQPDKLSSALAGSKLNAVALTRGLFQDAWQVSCEVEEDTLTVSGDVNNLKAKDGLISLAKEIFDHYEIVDQITVAEELDIEEVNHGTTANQQLNLLHLDHRYAGMLPTYPLWHLTNENAKTATKELQDKVATRYGKEAKDISIQVDSTGTAYLTGEIRTSQDKWEIEELAWKTRGVSYVVNGLGIAS